MAVLAPDAYPGLRTQRGFDAVPKLRVFAVALMVFPAYYVLKPVGGDGYLAALVSYFLFLSWVAATMFGYHNPLEHRSPVRIALCLLWLVSLASYVMMNRGLLDSIQLAAADRWLMQVAGVSGVILVTSECLPTLEDIRRLLRVLTWGGAFCGSVAAMQFWLSLDITPYLKYVLPGFSLDQIAAGNADISSRGALNRVAGTSIDPIELGVVAGMLLPLAIYLAIHDVDRPLMRRWLPVVLIGVAIPASVSRSAFLGVGVSLGVFIVALPSARRLIGLACIPVAVLAMFVTARGLISTLKTYFFAGTSDPSIAHRVNTYPLVERLVGSAPWFGQGGGTYIAQNQVDIFDNQYLTMSVELGLVGLVALLIFNLWPVAAAFFARRRTADQELRDLCAALAGAELAAALCSATFDSLSFPMFVNVQALVIGLIGAAWLLAERETVMSPWSRPLSWSADEAVHRRRRAGLEAAELGGGE